MDRATAKAELMKRGLSEAEADAKLDAYAAKARGAAPPVEAPKAEGNPKAPAKAAPAKAEVPKVAPAKVEPAPVPAPVEDLVDAGSTTQAAQDYINKVEDAYRRGLESHLAAAAPTPSSGSRMTEKAGRASERMSDVAQTVYEAAEPIARQAGEVAQTYGAPATRVAPSLWSAYYASTEPVMQRGLAKYHEVVDPAVKRISEKSGRVATFAERAGERKAEERAAAQKAAASAAALRSTLRQPTYLDAAKPGWKPSEKFRTTAEDIRDRAVMRAWIYEKPERINLTKADLAASFDEEDLDKAMNDPDIRKKAGL